MSVKKQLAEVTLYSTNKSLNHKDECENVSHSVMSDSLRPCGLYPIRVLGPWNSPGKNTGVGCHFILQGIFPTQGLNPGLLHCRRILYRLSYQGSPFLKGWYPFYLLILQARDLSGPFSITL